jgi:(S)-2-hydroxyglutarate dehydrogenase
MDKSADVIVVGGGIVGLAVAYRLATSTRARSVIVLEKESAVCTHQSGRNSGVMHSGIYYKPGSLKAALCVRGRRQMEEFCEREGVAWRRCGKVIAAVDHREAAALPALVERGKANGVDCRAINGHEVRELEPHCAGVAGIHVRDTGVVDYIGVCNRLVDRIRERGGEVLTNAAVRAVESNTDGVYAATTAGRIGGKYLINCAGLHSDRVARLTGDEAPVEIVPFRGEYYSLLRPELCRTLIYPVPDPAFPFLGVHFTRGFDDHVHCGPNAVLAFAREGYRRGDISLRDLREVFGFGGFRRMALKHWRMGLGEMWRSVVKGAFVRAAGRLVPELRSADLVASPAGVRAMAVALDGAMVDDFMISRRDRITNVLNAPSPAATASLAIAEVVVEKAGL